MTKSSNIAGIEKISERSWQDWLEFFADIQAEALDHPTIAKHVYDQLRNIEDINAGWWAQSITVAYEQHIGRRTPGQSGEGDFQVSVSRTLDGSMDDAMQRWITLSADTSEFNDIAAIDSPRTTETDKWRHWRINLADGSLVTASAQQKSDDKAILTVTNTKLASAEAVESWRSFWKGFLQRL
jgi:hypothetical protein